MSAGWDPGRQLAGRPGERAHLGALLADAAAGTARGLVVLGEAGVGKSSLVRSAAAEAPAGAVVMLATCLPLGALTSPLLPIRTALRSLPGSAAPLRSLLVPSSPDPFPLDLWLTEACADHLVLLVVDDAQWADQSTLDLVQYLLAGPRDRRLAVLVTVRSSELDDGHPLHRWLADVRRLPGTADLRLGPLDRAATATQLADLLGGSPHQSLVDDVFRRSRGNPYLTALLAAGVPVDARRLGDELPVDLESAVLRPWHELPEPGRRLASLLAVAGRRTDLDLLQAVGTAVGLGDAAAFVDQATRHGLVELHDQAVWFSHPLQAEVLQRRLPDRTRRDWHAAFARELTLVEGAGTDTAVALADHLDRAGDPGRAYRQALRAWHEAGRARATPELLALLHRTVELHDLVPDAPETRDQLLDWLRAAAEAAGADELELETVEALLSTLDPASQPLLVAQHLLRRMMLRLSTGRGFAEQADVRTALALTSAEPGSWQHALARAEIAHLAMWAGDEAVAAAESAQALELARAAGHPRALSFALTARAIATLDGGAPARARQLADEAVEAAVAANDWWAYVHAAAWQLNATEVWSSRRHADGLRAHRERLTLLGAPTPYRARLAANEAAARLAAGDGARCAELLRVPLGTNPGPGADVCARLTAALFAANQGRLAEAEGHLARADELVVEQTAYLALSFDAVRTSVHLAHGRTEQAYAAALVGATSGGIPPTMCQWLLPLAARALADRVQRSRERGETPHEDLGRLEELVTRLPHVLADAEVFTDLGRAQDDALQAWYVAEVARARRDAAAVALWAAAAAAIRAAELPWDEAYVCYRAAEAALVAARGDRAHGSQLLRTGHALAVRLGATPLTRDLEALATTARVPLSQPGARPLQVPRPGPSLTRREREILDHVVAGRTYAEIAESLVISEKTVSSHLSNLLRKTGTRSRVELARLVAPDPR